MTKFELDIGAQAEALARVSRHYLAAGAASLQAVGAVARGASGVSLVGMGSSRAASLTAATTIGARWPTRVHEAGELLHYGMRTIDPDALVVLVSQSGRSFETLTVGQQLRAAGHRRIIAVTNDPSSPMANLADVVLPIEAGDEATVSTKTWMTSFAVLTMLAATLVHDVGTVDGIPEAVLEAVRGTCTAERLADAAADQLAACSALVVVARGPALAAADYGALILKETTATPVECLAGGSFRHGPFELIGPAVGVIVLAPSGSTRDLCIALAQETAALGSPTWLIDDDAGSAPAQTERLRVTTLPRVAELYSPLTLGVPLQRLAAHLARMRGREPGALLRSRKVTDRE
ncbi:MAG: SIS domain-containing protein [Chloroflexi bacterium]|nr:SIS domain-containing protein [Chloroflexota bacterium]